MSGIEIFRAPNSEVFVEVHFEKDTVWLSQSQLANLFNQTKQNISLHINNCLKEEELDSDSVVKESLTTAADGKKYKTKYYNLDVIISVGYRVKSKRGVQFRQWATERLKEYLVKGYAINAKRLEENKTQFLQTLEDLKLFSIHNNSIEAKDILSLIQSFSETFFALDRYDKNEFPLKGTQKEITANAAELRTALEQLKGELIKKGEATRLFAQEKSSGNLDGIFGNVFQSVFGEDAYPSIEEKAAHLMYFIIKNHPFNDGNKRSGAFAFIWLLQKSGHDFIKKISPETLTTLTLLIAESDPLAKEKMVGIVMLLLQNYPNH